MSTCLVTKGERETKASPRPTALLTIVAPTFNERDNIRPLAKAITESLGEIAWELIVVDDDSPDETWRVARALGLEGAPVRCLRRIGRRGLSSAVVEGAMAAQGEFVAVIDADGQHDERVLADMLTALLETHADLVVASRYAAGGGLGAWTKRRSTMSAIATACARLVIGSQVSDPMSGYFLTRRSVFDNLVGDLSQHGYKILLDVLTSSPQPLRVVEVPYVFRDRVIGDSKLGFLVVAEYLLLLVEKVSRGYVPARFIVFSAVGGLGLAVHLSTLQASKGFGLGFLQSQTIATLVAMTFNFLLNNVTTYRSERLHGLRAVVGYGLFCATCSLGALANLSVANLVIGHGSSWAFAGAAGALMSAVFNFSLSTRFVWGGGVRAKPVQAAGADERSSPHFETQAVGVPPASITSSGSIITTQRGT